MALRYAYPGTSLVPVSAGELKRGRVWRDPVVVEFRAGVNMGFIAEQVSKERSVLLDAAVGAGKSTLFPSALATCTRQLVMHVAPNAHLVRDLYQYKLRMRNNGEIGPPLELWSGGDQKVPRSGVLYISAAQLIALIIDKGLISQWGSVTVFLDEAHESDAYTHLIRTMALELGAERLVQASATFHPTGNRRRETLGNIKLDTYPADIDPNTWSPTDIGKPWSMATLQDNMLVFIDSCSAAANIKREFEAYGYMVFRLESRSTAEEVDLALRTLRDKREALVILLADYSFRSGFTFDVGTIVDTATVSYYDPVPGSVRRLVRPAYAIEVEQAFGRGGRERPGVVRCFRPEGQLETSICDLEGTEREAAAYLSRCLGFKPLGCIAGTLMATADLPEKVNSSQALNLLYPLTYYITNSAGSSRSATPVTEQSQDSRDGHNSKVEAPSYTTDIDYLEYLDQLSLKNSGDSDYLVPGVYYHVSGVTSNEPFTADFPQGLRSVRRFVESPDGEFKVLGLSPSSRRYAMSLAVKRYNLLNVEAEAIDAALKVVAEQIRDGKSYDRTGVIQTFEDLAEVKAERVQVLGMLGILAGNDYTIKEFGGMPKLVERRMLAHLDLLCKSEKEDMFDIASWTDEDAGRDVRKKISYDEERLDRRRREKRDKKQEDKHITRIVLPAKGLFGGQRVIEHERKASSSSGSSRLTFRF